MAEKILQHLIARGYQARMVSIDHLQDLRRSIEYQHDQELFDPEFYRERLSGFPYSPPEELPGARSLVIVAYRDPPVRLWFRWNGKRIPAVVPPTYLGWQEKDRQVEQLLADLLAPRGCRLAPVILPKKLLAACSGLAVYGKNNICYIEGLGSFHRLAAFCSDLPCEQDDWAEPRMMIACERCQACQRSCPTRAIDPERFLLRAERCLTFRNEKPGEIPFPEWLDDAWHNCLVGCMVCQRICPENREYRDWYEEGAEFSAGETELLVKGIPQSDLPPALLHKLERWDLLEWLEVLPRNLSALLGRNGH
jgi:epoxyqueuosine reductase